MMSWDYLCTIAAPAAYMHPMQLNQCMSHGAQKANAET